MPISYIPWPFQLLVAKVIITVIDPENPPARESKKLLQSYWTPIGWLYFCCLWSPSTVSPYRGNQITSKGFRLKETREYLDDIIEALVRILGLMLVLTAILLVISGSAFLCHFSGREALGLR